MKEMIDTTTKKKIDTTTKKNEIYLRFEEK